MKTYTKESLIEALKNIRDQGWILSNRQNNDGGIGNTLEDLLEIPENNLPLPNAAEWELKSQRKNTNSLITLFHLEPSPKAYKFVPAILLPRYGWKHKEAGEKHPDNEMSFRLTINALNYTNRGFSVKVDRQEEKVFIDFDHTQIDSNIDQKWIQHISQFENYQKIEPQPYWGFKDLFYKAGSKLHNCFFIQADSKRINKKLYFHYQNIYMLRNLDFDKFINAIETGNLFIEFDARTGHNHGTKFRLRKNALIDLYEEVREY